MPTSLLRGSAAGAAGTTALNAVTYLDMAVRGRPSSSTPELTVEGLAHRAGLDVPGQGEQRQNRLAGLGPLSGTATGVAIGAVIGLTRRIGIRLPLGVTGVAAGLGAMALTDSSMVVAGASDPRTWKPQDWVSDLIPHLAYGFVTAAVAIALDGGGRQSQRQGRRGQQQQQR